MRLVTRSDFDGLASGALLKSLGVIDSWTFVHPKDMQDGIVEVTENDVLANVPFVEGCGMWFDHHATEIARMGKNVSVAGDCRLAPSAARVIYDYYDGDKTLANFSELVEATDKVDAGQLSIDEIQNPTGWVLLGFIMDPRTGLGRFRNFSISNYDLMVDLLDRCAHMSIDEILALPDVKERTVLYAEQSELFKKMLLEKSRLDGNVIVTDLRNCEIIFAGNRFMIYSLFPKGNVSIWMVDGRGKQNCPLAVGYSILNRTCKSNIGALMYTYGGGGHMMVGTCQVPYDDADKVVSEMVERFKKDEAEL